MEIYLILAVGIVLLPLIYFGAMMGCRSLFEEEKNRKRLPLHSGLEFAVVISAEAAFFRIWQTGVESGEFGARFLLLFIMLAAMMVFCVMDFWEKIVPNMLLLVLVLLFMIITGLQGVANMDRMLYGLMPAALGVIFCALSFGLGYLFSRGSMGAGDVKLSLVMGLYLTGEYVAGAVLYGCIAAALFSVIQLTRKKLTRKDKIPFVPFLYIGLIIRFLAG